MIFDRRRIYLIGGAVALLALILVYFTRPQITPEQRVREQLAMLSHEPWTLLRVQDVRFVGSGEPTQIVLHGVRLDTGAPVVVGYLAQSPYTSPATMQRLREQNLVGRVSEVLLLPRSVGVEPFRSQIQAGATHVGVGFFAGLPEWTAKAKPEASVAPVEGVEAPPASPPTPPDTTGATPRGSGHSG